jgi:acetyl-CoA carboxylase biotin carboxylase subunit
MFQRILIANRGEIALRVIRTAREQGIETVAVYSEADACALHTRLADQAIALGGLLPAESYLDMDKILDAAKRTGAEAVHPGYGFLAENAEFARRVVEAGMAWIGPPPEAITQMGDKIVSRQIMKAANVPMVPGMTEPAADADAARAAADEMGYPVMLKAAAGGGGKGIRIVHEPTELAGAFKTASGEALAGFGDGRMYVERYLVNTRHIEIQVMFDAHGNGVHFGERECSMQRRHQKLVEECPSPAVSEAMRQEMGAAALRAGAAVDYEGAGTVEFLASGDEFFFLEMNTRLQVEHPVTEMVTGVDLVWEQLRVAAGQELGYGQDAIAMTGHSIEVRLNAEDPSNNFLPSIGTIGNIRIPGGPWVRFDSGIYSDMEVGLNYDPMLGKLIVWAPDREQAIARMRRSLEELNIGGVRTSAVAGLAVMNDAGFQSGEFHTQYLENMELTEPASDLDKVVAAATAMRRWKQANRAALAPRDADRLGWIARGRVGKATHPHIAGSTSGFTREGNRS